MPAEEPDMPDVYSNPSSSGALANGSNVPPATPDPLSPGRTDLNPSDEPGIDELPDNDGTLPTDDIDAVDPDDMPDTDPDNAEMDDQPNPR
jgi:hypothetical protein